MLLNKKHVRDHILARVKLTRPGWPCTRVSNVAMNALELKVTEMINRTIHAHPSVGQTFREVL